MRWRLPLIGELLFILVALIGAMTAALVLISGINPLENAAMLVIGAVSVVVVVIFQEGHIVVAEKSLHVSTKVASIRGDWR